VAITFDLPLISYLSFLTMNSMKISPQAVGRIPGQENDRFLAARFGDRISLAAALSRLVISGEV